MLTILRNTKGSGGEGREVLEDTFKRAWMSPASSDSTMNLCSGELKHVRMGWFQVSVGKSLLYIQNMAAMEQIIEMLDILGPNIFLTFHYCVLTGPQTDILGKIYQICVEQGWTI